MKVYLILISGFFEYRISLMFAGINECILEFLQLYIILSSIG